MAVDELHRLCVRLLGHGPDGAAAEQEARDGDSSTREALLRAGIVALRARTAEPAVAEASRSQPADLAATIAAELRSATDTLRPGQRELLALRELIGLEHRQIAGVTGLDADAVPAALAEARLDLRTALRGPSAPAPECVERRRALDAIARRQDGEEVRPADEDWLIEHLGHCRGCGQAHAAMLEASACYQAWAPDDGAAAAAAA